MEFLAGTTLFGVASLVTLAIVLYSRDIASHSTERERLTKRPHRSVSCMLKSFIAGSRRRHCVLAQRQASTELK